MSETTKRSGVGADYDAVVIGGGPAGLSAALYLGRSRRRALVVDTGQPRNAKSHASHGVFTRDGTPPGELLAEARRQLATYPTIAFRPVAAVRASIAPGGFNVRLEDGDKIVRARKLVLACGIRDELPPIEGLADNWGTRVFNCTYCHGFEESDRPLALLAREKVGLQSVASLLQLSKDLVVFTDGQGELSENDRRRVEGWGAKIVEAKITRVTGGTDGLAVHFADGSVLSRSAMLVKPTLHFASDLPVQLGCEQSGPGGLVVDATWQTTVAGLYAAGDIAIHRRSVAMAAASGVEAGVCIDLALTEEAVASA
jgi:thioredoxin reductase